jgi:hypothetical protein
VLVIVAMSALLVWRHRKNIANLLAGKESRIGTKSSVTGMKGGMKGDGKDDMKDGGAGRSRKGGHRRIV